MEETTYETIETTDNEYVVISQVVIPDNTIVGIHFELTAKWKEGNEGEPGDSYNTIVQATFTNINGDVSPIQSPITIYCVASQLDSFHDPVWQNQYDIEGRNVRIRVRGALNQTIEWKLSKTVKIDNL